MHGFDASAGQEALRVLLYQRGSVEQFLCLETGQKQNGQLLLYKAL
tara:strand:- start:224 stop:361 length:138 start_codon:yes stop_codon:yes gene_type:complete